MTIVLYIEFYKMFKGRIRHICCNIIGYVIPYVSTKITKSFIYSFGPTNWNVNRLTPPCLIVMI